MKYARYPLFFLGSLFLPGVAAAHGISPGLGDFYEGALHPILSPEQALVLVASGFGAGWAGAACGRCGLLLFGVGLIVACMFGLSGAIPDVALVRLVLGIVLLCSGLVVAVDRNLAGLSVISSLFAGLAIPLGNLADLPVGVDCLVFALGLFLAAVVSFLGAAALGVRLGAAGSLVRLVARVVASWVSAVGAMLVAVVLLR